MKPARPTTLHGQYPSAARETRYPARSAYPRRLPRRARYSLSSWLLFAGVMLLFSLLLLPFFLFGGFYSYYMLSERTFPGMKVGNIDAGSLTRSELSLRLETEWNRLQRLQLTDGVNTWMVTPGEVGIWVDAAETARQAYQYGRGQDAFQQVLWLLRYGQVKVDPVVRFDAQRAQAGLQQLAGRVNQPAQNAALRYENDDWVAVPGQPGKAVDIARTLQQLIPDPAQVLYNGYLPVVVRPVAPQVSDLSPALAQLRSALDNSLLLRAYDPVTDETIEWRVPRETFARWVTVSMAGDQPSFSLDGQQFASYLQSWAASLGPERTLETTAIPDDLAERWQSGRAVNLTMRHQPTTYTVVSGDTLTRIAFKVGMPYWMIQQANPGLQADNIYAGQVLTIPSKNDLLPLPVVPNKRIVISISQQRMWTYEDGSRRNEWIISTGIDRSPTIPGIFQVQTHESLAYASVWDLHMPNFIGIYEAWPGFMNGIHGLPTLSSGNRLWAGNLGRPVSYGCIILGLQEAEDLYSWAEKGVVVEIQP